MMREIATKMFALAKDKTTYNILTAFSLTMSAFFMRPSEKASTVFSGLAAFTYGGYLLAKNHQVRQHNNQLILLNNHLRQHLLGVPQPQGVNVPIPLNPPNQFGIAGYFVDWMIPAFSGLTFALLPLINLGLGEEDSTATFFYGLFSILGGACLGLQHYGASNLRRFNDQLEGQHTTMVNLL